MPLEIYPWTPKPAVVLTFDEQYDTLVSRMDGQNEQRRSLTRFPTRRFGLGYNVVAPATEENLLYTFFKKHRGGLTAFWFVLEQSKYLYDEYVGRGDGATLTFDLHSKSTVNDATLKILVDGVEKTVVTHWNLSAGTGEAGVDRVVFTAGNAPATGALVTHHGWGKLRIKGVLGDKFAGRSISPLYDGLEVISVREEHW